MTETELDRVHGAMTAAPEDDAARLRFYERFADAELFLLLEHEPDDANVSPVLADIDGVRYALVFDREERLAEFAGSAAFYAALPGRGLAQMLAGQGIGLALNPEVASSAFLAPPDAVDWLVATLAHAPDETAARLVEVAPPRGLPEAVRSALDRKLGIAAGLAQAAFLVAARYADGTRGHVLAFVDAAEQAERALANAAGEALTFSGIEAGQMDVMFVRSSDAIAARLAKVGLRFDFSAPERAARPAAPGSDPARPPKLR